MAVQSQVPSSVASWAAKPAPFSTSKGSTRVKLSGDSSVVERVEPKLYWCGALVYTKDRLPLGRVWQTTILSTTTEWNGGLVNGCHC